MKGANIPIYAESLLLSCHCCPLLMGPPALDEADCMELRTLDGTKSVLARAPSSRRRALAWRSVRAVQTHVRWRRAGAGRWLTTLRPGWGGHWRLKSEARVLELRCAASTGTGCLHPCLLCLRHPALCCGSCREKTRGFQTIRCLRQRQDEDEGCCCASVSRSENSEGPHGLDLHGGELSLFLRDQHWEQGIGRKLPFSSCLSPTLTEFSLLWPQLRPV